MVLLLVFNHRVFMKISPKEIVVWGLTLEGAGCNLLPQPSSDSSLAVHAPKIPDLPLSCTMELDDISNIAIPYGPNTSTCGYCSPPGQRSNAETSYHTASLEAIKLSCEVRFCPLPGVIAH